MQAPHFGNYRILARLSAGGMATLYLAQRSGAAGFSRHVAIKVVHPHLARDSQFVRMFVDEAKLSARIQHPNVVHVEELGEVEGTYYLAMEYVHGFSFAQVLAALARKKRRLAPKLAVWIAMRIADGLHQAHETTDAEGRHLGVVHRDVSPQNILISANGHVKLIDFGIAKAFGRQYKTVTGSLKGKLKYMAPEQARASAVDRRTDIYALAIVLWETLAMRRLFKADNDFELLEKVRNPDVPSPRLFAGHDISDALEQAVLGALAKRPEDRPQTALAFLRNLAAACPEAAAVDASRAADLLREVLGPELKAKSQALPKGDLPHLRAVPSAEPLQDEHENSELRDLTAAPAHRRSRRGCALDVDADRGEHSTSLPSAITPHDFASVPPASEKTLSEQEELTKPAPIGNQAMDVEVLFRDNSAVQAQPAQPLPARQSDMATPTVAAQHSHPGTAAHADYNQPTPPWQQRWLRWTDALRRHCGAHFNRKHAVFAALVTIMLVGLSLATLTWWQVASLSDPPPRHGRNPAPANKEQVLPTQQRPKAGALLRRWPQAGRVVPPRAKKPNELREEKSTNFDTPPLTTALPLLADKPSSDKKKEHAQHTRHRQRTRHHSKSTVSQSRATTASDTGQHTRRRQRSETPPAVTAKAQKRTTWPPNPLRPTSQPQRITTDKNESVVRNVPIFEDDSFSP